MNIESKSGDDLSVDTTARSMADSTIEVSYCSLKEPELAVRALQESINVYCCY
jgi:hypothetical protein